MFLTFGYCREHLNRECIDNSGDKTILLCISVFIVFSVLSTTPLAKKCISPLSKPLFDLK